MPPKKEPHFTPELFSYLKTLKRNNNREWFNKNKGRYEELVKGALLRFIDDFGPHLEKISRCFVADPRTTGGSMFRIYRDVRFSKNKAPYKTHAAAQFRHEAGKDAHAPGFYLHLEPGSVFTGAGLWRPDGASVKAIRQAIVDDEKGWRRAVGSKAFLANAELSGESLKRPPRGFDADHPLIEDLKRKDFIAGINFSEADACSADFLAKFVTACKTFAPLVKFLTQAVGQPY